MMTDNDLDEVERNLLQDFQIKHLHCNNCSKYQYGTVLNIKNNMMADFAVYGFRAKIPDFVNDNTMYNLKIVTVETYSYDNLHRCLLWINKEKQTVSYLCDLKLVKNQHSSGSGFIKDLCPLVYGEIQTTSLSNFKNKDVLYKFCKMKYAALNKKYAELIKAQKPIAEQNLADYRLWKKQVQVERLKQRLEEDFR